MRQLDDLRIGKAGPAFTSDLSVDEFLLVTEAGFQPLGLVVGSSIYHVGAQFKSWLAADGVPNAQIARTVGVSRPTVIDEIDVVVATLAG